jgi:predicted 3-demethylubiquinone-9 3-methyltransferase (glyoxalase superfamily)
MQTITPCLWFGGNAEEAVRFYTGIFPGSRITATTRYATSDHMPKGAVLTIAFQLNGQDYLAINAEPVFTFSPAISLMVKCESQDEIDRYWDKLSADRSAEQCGWLKDKYGLSWQIVPAILDRLMADPDPAKAERLQAAILEMKKLDIAALKRAHAG